MEQPAESLILKEVHAVGELGVEQEIVWTPAEMFAEVHGDRHLHLGVRWT